MDELILKIEDYIQHFNGRFGCVCNFEGSGKSVFIYYTDGSGVIRVSVGDGDNYGFISDLFIKGDCRGLGFGGTLLDVCNRIICIMGLPFSQLRVLKGSWMEDWYKKKYFVPLFEENGYIFMIKKQ